MSEEAKRPGGVLRDLFARVVSGLGRASALPGSLTKKLPVVWVEAIVVMLAFGLIAIAALTAQTTREKTLANEMNGLARLSLILAEQTQRVFFSSDLLISSLEDDISPSTLRTSEQFRRRVATPQMHKRMQDRVLLASDVDALSFFDATGMLVNSSRVWPVPESSISDRPYFTALRDSASSDMFISEPLKNRLTGQSSIFLGRRISSADGRFLGIVLATIATSRFEKLFASVLSGEGATISLLRRDSVLLIRQPQTSDAANQSPQVQRFFQETLARSEQGTLRTTGDASPRLMALHAVRGYPLLLNVTNSEPLVLAEWWQLAKLLFAFAAAAIVLLVLLGLAFIRQAKMQDRAVGAAAQLARANDELESFSYSIAHDLRAPLRAMRGYSAILLEDNSGKLSEASTSHLGRIDAGAQRMSLLIDDLLLLAHIGRTQMTRRDFGLGDLARTVAGSLAEAHPQRRIQLVVAPGMRANGDPGLIRTVLENLLGNAWKFTSNSKDARVESGAESRDGRTVFFIKDNGAGFDMRYADKLFQPFQRLHRADEFEGTGIGLSIVRRIINRHDGEIWAESEPGKGTIFRFTLSRK